MSCGFGFDVRVPVGNHEEGPANSNQMACHPPAAFQFASRRD